MLSPGFWPKLLNHICKTHIMERFIIELNILNQLPCTEEASLNAVLTWRDWDLLLPSELLSVVQIRLPPQHYKPIRQFWNGHFRAKQHLSTTLLKFVTASATSYAAAAMGCAPIWSWLAHASSYQLGTKHSADWNSKYSWHSKRYFDCRLQSLQYLQP